MDDRSEPRRSMTDRVLLEIAAFDPASALVAARSGADRIELCRDAAAGGLTPPLDWVREVTEATDLPVVVMVRAHADGWTFSPTEHAAMREDARRVLDAGAAGIVWGALDRTGRIASDALRALVETAGPSPVIVHRAVDAARDLDEAMDALVACGARRVLTSGGTANALAGADRLAHLIERLGADLAVMPGGGVRASNVAEVVPRTGAREVHSGASLPGSGHVDAIEVRRLRAVLDALRA
ncbi:copper homeostasis protein CutC [Rubrivirga sp. SAORIC476]|uniref:copper homeostasis protein CutC n=1 Tax=Rubrivirga sp. SAORIC476 TaxID=1961794 RepID=UPI000BA8E842|nr:copper homeostasis protein CutC [Rubrivirga sp. SAORIC476]